MEPGQFVSIIGPNGAGKSTLINVLTGLLEPSTGAVRFKGRDIAGAGPVRAARLGLARSFQLVQIFPELTVLETLQAEQDLTRARLDYMKTVAELNRAQYALSRATGRL